MRSQPHALFVVREVAPMTGRSSAAIFARDFCRALAAAGTRVTIAAARRPDFTPETAGLARLLEPRDRGGTSLVEHEGALEGGDCELVVFETPEGGEPSAELVARAALARAAEAGTPATALHTTGATTDACSAATEDIRVFVHLATTEIEDFGDRAASATVILPSRDAAKSALRGALASRQVRGIPMGVDDRQWNPRRDALLAEPFEPTDPESRSRAKRHLQQHVGLPVREAIPMIGILGAAPLVGRATGEALLGMGAQIVCSRPDANLEALANRSPRTVSAARRSSESEVRTCAHRIAAGSDLILVGHTGGELVSSAGFLRYGTPAVAPLASEWADRIVEFDPISKSGSGFHFKPGDAQSLLAAIQRGLKCVDSAELRAALAERTVAVDTDWSTAAFRTLELYSFRSRGN